MPHRLILTLAVLAASGVLPAFATPAPARARARASIHVRPAAVRAGATTRVYGSAAGCELGDTVTLISSAFTHAHDFAGLPAIFAHVHAGGRYSVHTRIPAGRRPSRYAISARCGGGNLGVHATITVLGALSAAAWDAP